MRLSSAAARAGVSGRLKDASPVVGTFENMSAKQFGPKYVRLWETLRGGEALRGEPTKVGSDYHDHVRVSEAGPNLLEVALLSQGRVKQTARMPYMARGNYLHLRHDSDFDWLPLGYGYDNSDLAVTGVKNGELVVLHRYEFFGLVMLFGSAGDSGTVELRFPRVGSKRVVD